jgi:hypothetical protein
MGQIFCRAKFNIVINERIFYIFYVFDFSVVFFIYI